MRLSASESRASGRRRADRKYEEIAYGFGRGHAAKAVASRRLDDPTKADVIECQVRLPMEGAMIASEGDYQVCAQVAARMKEVAEELKACYETVREVQRRIDALREPLNGRLGPELATEYTGLQVELSDAMRPFLRKAEQLSDLAHELISRSDSWAAKRERDRIQRAPSAGSSPGGVS
jgi:hypothetical protein